MWKYLYYSTIFLYNKDRLVRGIRITIVKENSRFRRRVWMNRRLRKIIINVLFALLFFVLYIVLKFGVGKILQKDDRILNDNWTVQIGEEVFQDVKLSSFFFPATDKEDVVKLTTILPNTDIERAVLQFRAWHSKVNVYLGGNCIYSYGKRLTEQNKMVGSGYFWITIPERYQGKELCIQLDVTEDDAFTNVEPMYLQQEKDSTIHFISKNIIEIFIGVFLLGFGILLIVIVFLVGKFNNEYRSLFWIAIFSVLVALWMMCNFGIIQLVIFNRTFIAYIEYLSLYFLPVTMLAFVYESQTEEKIRKIVKVWGGVFCLFNLALILLNGLHIYHLPKFLKAFHMLGLFTIFFIVILSIIKWRGKKQKSEQILLQGLSIMALFVLGDLIRFNVEKYLHPTEIYTSSSVLPIGVLIFVMSMLASYVYRLVQSFYEAAEKQTLLQIAYSDALTGLGNRAMCQKIFQELEGTGKGVSMINLDLNNFKEVNDNFRHAVGDELLIDFANLLKENYKERGFVGRMGGDEFIIILENDEEDFTKASIDTLLEKIERENAKEEKAYKISVAYGYVTNKENKEMSMWYMYEISDKNMYACKMKQK